MSDLTLGSNCSRVESILPTRPLFSDVESLNNQLPALPILLELVIRRINDCGFRKMLSFGSPVELIEEHMSAESAITSYHALRKASLTKDVTSALTSNERGRLLVVASNAF